VLQFCIDDSGTDQEPVFVLAGYTARVKNWAYFSEDWDKALRKSPKIEYLKTYDTFHLTKKKTQFFGWTQDAVERKLLSLAEVIHKYRLERTQAVIRHADFNAVLKRSHKQFREPSFFTLGAIMFGVLSHARNHRQREKVEFIFDEEVVRPAQLDTAYKIIMGRLDRKDADLIASKPCFKNDKEFMPLQAADLIACYLRRASFEKEKGGELLSPVWAALQATPCADFSLDRNDMLDIVRDMTEATFAGRVMRRGN
jgi:hypothetical protein